MLRLLATLERDPVLGGYLVVIRTAGPVIDLAVAMTDDRTCGG